MCARRKADLHRIGQAQHGLLTVAQAQDAGWARDGLYDLAEKGELLRVHQGVYRLRGVERSWRGDLLAAVLATGPKSVASHLSAARLHGLQGLPTPAQPEICAVGPALPLLDGVTVHRTRRLEPHDRTVVDGVPVTTGARTVIDLAGTLARPELTALVDETILRRATSRFWLYRRASALRSGRRGVGLIMTLTGPEAEGEFWSWLERRGNRVLRDAGLPAPQWNVKVFAGDGRLIGVVDAFYDRARVILQFDGLQFHRLPDQHGRDLEQTNVAQLNGFTLLRFTWRDVVERPEYVAAQVRGALVLYFGSGCGGMVADLGPSEGSSAFLPPSR